MIVTPMPSDLAIEFAVINPMKEISADRNLTLDIDLDEFITADSYSQYIVNVDLFGYK